MARLDGYAAVLFDLDGVITSTARQHFAAWKEMFDDFLDMCAERNGEPFIPFGDDDYHRHVDGMPRYDGVRRFLAERGMTLEEGGPDDPPDAETVHGLGNRKNELVNDIIRRDGVEVYDGSLALLHQVRDQGIKTAVVSSSRNCQTILRAAGITDLFDVRVDGVVAAELGLPGKPAPDTFLAAAERLGVPPQRSVVVEDALSGVEAGRNGGFGLVIGVNRVGQGEALRDHGADVVVTDLAELLSS
ncbi:MAG: beta-phosphoglucomutase family hydrolase [Nitriliruptorales bacterium]|nr:beta-phosphoglucomutase family hydrolase [Nitriliruptorales bacterium]